MWLPLGWTRAILSNWTCIDTTHPLKYTRPFFPPCFWRSHFLWILIWPVGAKMLEYSWGKLGHICVGWGYGRNKSMGEHLVKDVREHGQRTWRSSQREATGITQKPAWCLAFLERGTSLSRISGERRATQGGWVELSLPLLASGALCKRQTPKLHRSPPPPQASKVPRPWQIWSKWTNYSIFCGIIGTKLKFESFLFKVLGLDSEIQEECLLWRERKGSRNETE